MTPNNLVSVPIYVWDSAPKEKLQELIDENERLGYIKNKIPKLVTDMAIVDFYFSPSQFTGYWIDVSVNDDTHTMDIIFYIGGTSFRTISKAETVLLFNDILKNQK
jgi:hypothetical protein